MFRVTAVTLRPPVDYLSVVLYFWAVSMDNDYASFICSHLQTYVPFAAPALFSLLYRTSSGRVQISQVSFI